MKNFFLIFFASITLFRTEASDIAPFVKYQVDNGLSHNTVWCALQDSYDFMWFGTSDGLNCFDGNNFRTFRNDTRDPSTIGNNFVHSLYEDPRQNLWVGTNNGLYIFNRQTETFSFFDKKTEDGVLVSSTVRKIAMDDDGSIWIGTLGQGLFIFNPSTNELTQNSIYTSFVWNLIKAPNGDMFATSRQDGLIRFEKNGKYIRSYPVPADIHASTDINALCLVGNELWFSVGINGLYKLNLENGKTAPVVPSSGSPEAANIRSIHLFSPDELWLGGDNGLYSLNLTNLKLIRIDDPANPKSLSDQSVYDIISDREGGQWVCTYFGGINYRPLQSNPFLHIYPKQQAGSLSGKAVSRFCEDDDGNIWIATEDGGLNHYNVTTRAAISFLPVKNKNSISYHNTRSLLLDGNDLWIGTYSMGVDVMDINRKTFRNIQHRRDDLSSICDNSVNAIFKSHNSSIYVGTDWGLCQYDKTTKSFAIVEEVGALVHVSDILEDSCNWTWVATNNAGVFCFNPKTKRWNHYAHRPNDSQSISGNNVITLFEDKYHTVWFGTEDGGLCSFDRNTLTFTPFDPDKKLLPNQVIKAIEQDEFGNFWIATNSGLIRINPYSKHNRRLFTKNDGLQSNQFNSRASLKTRDGKMYFGGINGFNAFYPKDFSENQYVPNVRITEFKLFNKTVRVADAESPLSAPVYKQRKITLKHNLNTFSLSFAALSYQAPHKNRYVYRMEGVDNDWIEVDNGVNTAYYTNLSPGKYKFRVKGSNNDGLWNDKETVIDVNILPPFYKSGWAYAVYLLLTLGLIIGTVLLRVERLQKMHDERMKTLLDKQEKESYLSRINFFTNLAHEIRTPLTLIKLPLDQIVRSGDGNAETKNYLATMQKNSDYLLNLINQLLDFRKTEQVEYQLDIKQCNVSHILRDLFARFKPSAEVKSIEFSVLLPKKDLMADIDNEAVTKIVSNLLSNALKYARSKVSIELTASDTSFDIRIVDDGKGIKTEDSNRVFEVFFQSDNSESGTGIGLALAKSLAEKHKGKLTQQNNATSGSTFTLSLPLDIHVGKTQPSLKRDFVELAPGYQTSDFALLQNEGKTNAHILLVEDNADLLQLTAEYMKAYFKVSMAANGKEALLLLEQHPFDLVVSDVMMPEMDGYQLCEAIKNDDRLCHIPIVLLTAKTNVESKIMGLEHGSDAYLEKPFALEHLRTQANNLILSRQKLRELFASSPLIPSSEIAVAKKDKEFIERLNTEIEKKIADVDFSIDTLAENMNMSRSNFYRKIKSISGMSPNDYLKIIRLKRAAELLLKQEHRITEVYELTGFSSSSYFAKCFKEQFGMLPREFIQNSGKPTTA